VVKVNELIEKAHFETIIALSEALDAKDSYTAGHSRRVMQYSARIAWRMGLGDKEFELLKKSALLHDLGKIGVPDAILRKRDKLSDEEFDVIRAHPRIGADILRAVESFRALVPAVYYHHERFDGRGYPDGIKGEDIPVQARIISVADSFDAMTSNRAYRNAFPAEEALREIERNKGTQFDPHIADVFVSCTNSIVTDILRDSFAEPEYYL
jgi:HD-GYP domain-containing protein (c-di-GMP phosphodiesterase class II)